MPWRPILDGELAAQARAAIAAISDELPRYPCEPFSLSGGAAGLALYYAYANDDVRASDFLERAIDAASDGDVPPALFGGFTGVAWTLAHLRPDDGPDDLADIDAALLALVQRTPWPGKYDLISGLVGLAVYAVAQHRRGAAHGAAMLEYIVGRLEELAEPGRDGLTILTFPASSSEELRRAYPEGIYDLGVAHGVPGLIGVLGSVAGERARRLREGFTTWLRAVIGADRRGPLLPHLLDKRHPDQHTPARAAWCYGDPGAAVALLRGARAAGDPALEDLALTLARAAAARPIADSAVRSAGLCHGAAGLLHIFNRLYQATGEPSFHATAITWAKETIRYREDTGIAGYGLSTSEADPGLLTGAAGVGLALLAATSEVEPRWDATLLCDVPPLR